MRYSILVVDDERLERAALETLVDWQSIDIDFTGAVSNGIEGLEKIHQCQPDIVITDIKMPVMDGISLVREAKKIYPHICFIVLSGHGEYQYTSQAMELGVRHYILKPVDSEKIILGVQKATAEVEAYRHNFRLRKQREEAIEKLLPNAKRAFFLRALSDTDLNETEYDFYMSRCTLTGQLALLTVKTFCPLQGTHHRILEETLPSLTESDQLILETIDHDALYLLLRAPRTAEVKGIVRKIKEKINDLGIGNVSFALSVMDGFHHIKEARQRNDHLIMIQDDKSQGRLISSEDETIPSEVLDGLMDLTNWARITDIAGVYRFSCRFCACLNTTDFSDKTRIVVLSFLIQRIGGDADISSNIERQNIFDALERVWLHHHDADSNGQDKRFQNILKGLFLNLPNQNLTVKKIAKDIAYMNEDHFSRIFHKQFGMKIKKYILVERMELAKSILLYKPEIMVSELSILAGYPDDGQYFSKVFKSYFGKTVSQFRKKSQNENC